MTTQLAKLPPLSEMQETAIDWALEREGSAWLMPPGCGKTRSWLEVIGETPGRTLIVAPKLVCIDTWPRERIKWGFEDLSMTFLHGRNKTAMRRPKGLADICLINYEGLPWLAEQLQGIKGRFPFDMIIFDELSKMKNPESKRFHAIDKVLHQFDYRSGGTGTPIGARMADLFGQMYCCDLGATLGTDYTRFKRQWFYEDEYTHALDPYEDTTEKLIEAVKPTAISFDINDLNMPPLNHIVETVKLSPGARKYYERMKKDSVIEELDVSACNGGVRSGKLRQLASGGVLDDDKNRKYLHDAKAERLKSIVEEYQGEPIMVFFEFRSDYEAICKALGQEVPALHGATKTRDAARFCKLWNDGKLPFFALHPRSAAYGLNLQDSGRVVVWYTSPWSYEMLNQGIARLWRQGQKNRVLAYYIAVEETIDETVLARLEERKGLHEQVMGGLLAKDRKGMK